jgi:hypothetical protein
LPLHCPSAFERIDMNRLRNHAHIVRVSQRAGYRPATTLISKINGHCLPVTNNRSRAAS